MRCESLKNSILFVKHQDSEQLDDLKYRELLQDDKMCNQFMRQSLSDICFNNYEQERENYIQSLIEKIQQLQHEKHFLLEHNSKLKSISESERVVSHPKSANKNSRSSKSKDNLESSTSNLLRQSQQSLQKLKENNFNNTQSTYFGETLKSVLSTINNENQQNYSKIQNGKQFGAGSQNLQVNNDQEYNDLFDKYQNLQKLIRDLESQLTQKDKQIQHQNQTIVNLQSEVQKYNQISKDLVKEKQKNQDHYMQQILDQKEQAGELEHRLQKEREKKESLKLELSGINQHYMRVIYDKIQEISQIKDQEHRQKRKNMKVKFSNNILKLQKTFEQKLKEKTYELEKYYGKKTDRNMNQSYNSRNENQNYNSRAKSANHHKTQSHGITSDEFMNTLQLGLSNSLASFESSSRNNTVQKRRKRNGIQRQNSMGSGIFASTSRSQSQLNQASLNNGDPSYSQQKLIENNISEQKSSLNAKVFSEQAKPDPTDPFDRQRRIEGWDQSKLEKSVCLLLGTGGLGCSVALGLARLGVGKIIMIDKDVVDISNLNRQILFDHNDIGQPKVQVAREKILQHHLINKSMIVEAYNMDALIEWQRIVEFSKEATVVFNMIDVGDYFDAAVQSLCLIKQLPLIQGGTFSQQLTVDIFLPNESCLSCSADTYDPELLNRLLPSQIESLESLEFIPRNNNPIGQSNSYLCIMCAQMMVSRFSSWLINDPEVMIQNRFIMTVNSADAFQFPVPREDKCLLCNDYEQNFQPEKWEQRLKEKEEKRLQLIKEQEELEQQARAKLLEEEQNLQNQDANLQQPKQEQEEKLIQTQEENQDQ
eukprot:403362263